MRQSLLSFFSSSFFKNISHLKISSAFIKCAIQFLNLFLDEQINNLLLVFFLFSCSFSSCSKIVHWYRNTVQAYNLILVRNLKEFHRKTQYLTTCKEMYSKFTCKIRVEINPLEKKNPRVLHCFFYTYKNFFPAATDLSL